MRTRSHDASIGHVHILQKTRAIRAVNVKKLLGSSLDFIDAFIKEARLLHDLKHDNIVGFKTLCHVPVVLMLEHVYFDLNVFGGEGKVTSLNDSMT